MAADKLLLINNISCSYSDLHFFLKKGLMKNPGNQEWNGIFADLAIAPINNNKAIIVIAVSFMNGDKLKITA